MGAVFIAWGAWSVGAWSGTFMTAFLALGAGWYALNTGMQTLRTVELTPDGLVLRYALRQPVLDMAQITGVEIVGPEVFSSTMRFFHGLRATRCRVPCKSRELGAVDLFGGIGKEMVVLHLVGRRPIVLNLERPAEFVAELGELIASRSASLDAAPARSPLDRWNWLVFAMPVLFAALCACFGLGWLINAKLRSSPLHRAAWSGSVAEVKRLVAESPELLEKPDRRGYTPLHIAVDRSPAVVAALLDAGANIEARSDLGNTPLQYAILPRANAKSFDLLLERGADMRTRNNRGETPLHTAATYRNVRAGRALLARGADVNARDDGGRTPLTLARPRKGGPTPDQQAIYKLIQDHGGKK